MPTFSPEPEAYSSGQYVEINCSTPAASIRYTTDGVDPTSTDGTVYSGPVEINTSIILKAIAYREGWEDSAVASGLYTIREIVFATSGPSFAPIIVVEGTPEILWTFADDSTSDATNPTVTFGTSGTREQRLMVTPWSAMNAIDLGYDGSDGGTLDPDIYDNAPQSVEAVYHLDLVAPSLEVWCSSYNGLQSLDFSDFTNLKTVECWECESLQSVNLTNTPSLERLCVDGCDLVELNLTGCPGLQDLRAGGNCFPTIVFPDLMPDLWHICTTTNPQLTAQDLFASTDRFPRFRQLWIWNNNQTGLLKVPQTGTGSVTIYAHGNFYSSVDFRGSLQGEGFWGGVGLQDNQIASIRIDECDQIVVLDLTNNLLDGAAVRYVLQTLDALGRSGGQVYLAGTGNSIPPPDAFDAINSLRGKGWAVVVNE